MFGYGIVSKVMDASGQMADYFDTQGDNISESDMTECVIEFQANSRVAKDMHKGDQRGHVMFSFPMTEEVAKGLGMTWVPPTSADDLHGPGWIVGVQFDEETFAKVLAGERAGFSIGGLGRREEVAE